jgi:hypothetical protein
VLASQSNSTPSKWWGWGSNDHGQFAQGELYAVNPAPVELSSINSLGLNQLSVGMNVCVGKSSSTREWFVWGENHGGSIMKSIQGDIVSPQRFGQSQVSYAGWSSVWIGNDESKSMLRYGIRDEEFELKTLNPSSVKEIASSAFQTLFLKSDGSVVFHNDRTDIEFSEVTLSHTFKNISRGWGHFLLLDDTGSVWVVGANKHGQCGLGHSSHVRSCVMQHHLY